MKKLGSRFRRLQWKLTWSYTWVAALSFLIIETVLLVLLMVALGFNPLQGGLQLFSDAVAPVIRDDIRPITTAHLRNQPVDTANLQADLEQILGNEPLALSGTPFEAEQFASVFVLDAQQNLLASTPQFIVLPPDGRFFDPSLLTGDDSLSPLISAAYSGDTSIEQPYTQTTSEALYLAFAEPLRDTDGRLLGVEVAIMRTPTPATLLLLVLGVVVGGLIIFALSAASVGSLFGWRLAKGFSGRLAHVAETTAAWGRGNFAQRIQDAEEDEVGELGANLNRVAAELQTLLKDKEQIAVLEERDRMARELHDTLAQGIAGLVLQLEVVMHRMDTNEIQSSRQIVSEATVEAREALQKARAVIDDLRAEAAFAPEYVKSVEKRAKSFSLAHGIVCEVDAQLPDTQVIPANVVHHARRALVEMLSNVAQHAEASKVQLNLSLDGQNLLIEVSDDGQGFEPETATRPGHYGILGLKERAQIMGGKFIIESGPNEGTSVTLRLPLELTT